MKPTVYIETTIVSYLTAWPSRDILRAAQEILTRDWWSKARPLFELYTSDYVINEASAGDPVAAAERLKALEGIPSLTTGDRVEVIAEQIRKQRIAGTGSF